MFQTIKVKCPFCVWPGYRQDLWRLLFSEELSEVHAKAAAAGTPTLTREVHDQALQGPSPALKDHMLI